MSVAKSLFSVVVPAFNAAGTIATALNSALSQDSPPREIVVVDDGSSDSTAEVAAAIDISIKVIRQPNGGAGAARRVGTAAARGEFVAYLDADDWWLPGWLSKARQIIESDDVHFLVADLARGTPGSTSDGLLPSNSENTPWARPFLVRRGQSAAISNLYRLDQGNALELLLRGYPVFPSCVVARRTSVEAVGNWDPRFRRAQDFDFALRMARRFPVHWLDEVVAVLGLHDANDEWLAYTLKQTHGDIEVLTAHLAGAGADTDYYEKVARGLARKLCSLGWQYRLAGKRDLSRATYARAAMLPGRRFHALSRWAASWIR